MERLIRRIRLWWPWRTTTVTKTDEICRLPYTAKEDLTIGDRLIVVNNSLFKWRRGYPGSATFIAKKDIKAGDPVFSDPTNPQRSDVMVITWKDRPIRSVVMRDI